MAVAGKSQNDGLILAAQICELIPGMVMEWLLENWRGFADWAAGQPVLVQIVIGTVLLTLAYVVFVGVLTKLTGRLPVSPRTHSDGGGR